ncbi:MAG: aminotransferase class I/II-fold pyridoxal phosphate-dependent enzyme [Bacillota bacterium]|nr:aminotransferase class I/II-fold pyridoxal phosphate-dependent enzyme [Bacillota bacterium]
MLKSKNWINNIPQPVVGRALDDIKKEYALEEAWDLSGNENPLGVSPLGAKAMAVAAAKASVAPDRSCSELRSALSSSLGVMEKELFFANGSAEILKALVLAYVDHGDEVILTETADFALGAIVDLCCGIKKSIPLNEDYITDLPYLASAISLKTKLLYFANPDKAAGTIVSKRNLLQVLHRIGKDHLIIIDESYGEFPDNPDHVDGLEIFKNFSNVVLIRSFSYAYGLAGLSLNYAVASPEIISEMNKTMTLPGFSPLAQAGALAAFLDKEHLKKSLDYIRVEREFLIDSLTELGITSVKSQANFLLVDTGMSGAVVVRALMAKGIIVRSGAEFGFPNSIRVSVGLHRENEGFLQALGEFLKN